MSDDELAFADSDDDFEDTPPKPIKKPPSQERKKKTKTKTTPSKRKTSTPSKRKISTPSKRKKASTSSQGTPAKKKRKTAAAAKKKGKPKVKTLTETDGKTALLNYMQKQNRPYSHTQLFDNLHGIIKKTQVPRILEALAIEGKLTLKTFKKTKLYFINQASFPAVPQERITEMQNELKQQQEAKQAQAQELSALKAELSRILSAPENSQLDGLLVPLEQKVAERRAKLASIVGEGRRVVSEADKKRLQDRFNVYYLAWKKRKKAVSEMVAEYCDNAGKKPKQFQEQLGVETDEEYSVSMEAWTPLYKKK